MDESFVNLYEHLPDWANDENIQKHADILKQNTELAALKGDCAELQERVNVLREHLKSVHSELATTQQLLTAKEQQVEAEKHLQQVADREQGKTMSSIAQIEQQTGDVMSKVDAVQSKIVISQRRINQFKEEAKMNQQELEQWIVIARQKEEDFLVLQRYHREDEGRVRSMLLEIEKATGIIEGKRGELEQEITQTRALQIELDMTAEQFRKMHEERAQLLAQWESTLQQMQALNDAIEKTTTGFETRKTTVEKLHTSVAQETRNLDLAVSENGKIERQLTIGDHQVSQRHRIYEKETVELADFNEVVETQRHALEKMESDARFYQEEIDDFRNKTQQENLKKEQFLERLHATQNALTTQKDQTGQLNDQTNLLSDFLKKEEVELKKLEMQIDAEKGQIFKLSQDVYQARKKEKNLLGEIQGSQTRAKNLALKIHDFDRETQKQMELLYNSNFQIQQMERKIARIEGDRTEEEKLELQSQIDQLSRILDGKLETEKTLSQQLHRLELDLRQTGRRRENLERARTNLEIKLTELRLDQESLDKSTLRARSLKENVLVRLNLLRLQVEKLTEQVATKSDELISLENRRQQLQLSMQERVIEIDAHLVALRTQLKTEEEARHYAAVELQERKRRAETLQAKYEVQMGKFKIEGEEVSQTYHVIRFAEERDKVNARGEELEQQVQTAIRELRAVERELQKLNGLNSDFRASFTAITDGDSDMERKRVLEEQLRVAEQRLNARRAEAHSVAEERLRMEQTHEQQQNRIAQMQEDITRMKSAIEKLTTENRELADKLRRATHMLGKAKEAHRRAANVPMDAKYPSTLLEMDVELRMERSTVETAVAELTKLAENNRDIEPKLRLGLSQIGIGMKTLGPKLGGAKSPTIVTPQTSGRSSGSVKSGASSGSSGSKGSSGSRGSTGSRKGKPSVQNVKLP